MRILLDDVDFENIDIFYRYSLSMSEKDKKSQNLIKFLNFYLFLNIGFDNENCKEDWMVNELSIGGGQVMVKCICTSECSTYLCSCRSCRNIN
ncbi:hypothetical protein BpHYR1_007449 [Brachionus plicatilis]|uniref:Uncharacterized protein n=1 Tax=Brachionus plicatilis TaxID=10195 RepID=A0A3M7RL95_BRAPC|nr:hypothetical protein BpHYR1_007449 [Brachionus plicatilis]